MDSNLEDNNVPLQSPLYVPVISKEKFVDILVFLQNQDKRFEKLSNITDTLAPGFHTNPFFNLSYNEKIISILDEMFGFKNGEDSMIAYFIYELDYGKKSADTPILAPDGSPIDLSSADKLYDFLIKTHPSTKGSRDQ